MLFVIDMIFALFTIANSAFLHVHCSLPQRKHHCVDINTTLMQKRQNFCIYSNFYCSNIRLKSTSVKNITKVDYKRIGY